MRIAWWMHKATNTHSEYVIIIVFHCNNGNVNAPVCYVIRTLSFLFKLVCASFRTFSWTVVTSGGRKQLRSLSNHILQNLLFSVRRLCQGFPFYSPTLTVFCVPVDLMMKTFVFIIPSVHSTRLITSLHICVITFDKCNKF